MDETAEPQTVDPDARIRYYLGEIMPHFLGSIPGKTVRQIVARMVGGKV